VKTKNIILIAIGIVGFFAGAVNQYLFPGRVYPPSDIPFLVTLTLLSFAWYRMDSEQIGYRRSVWLNVGVLALAVVALPYYFFRSRGAKRGFIAVGLFILLLLGYWALETAGLYSIYYGLQR
jgi:hypothetical protein